MVSTSLAAPTIGANMDKTERHAAWSIQKIKIYGTYNVLVSRDDAVTHGMMFYNGLECGMCKNTTRYVSTRRCRTCKVNANAVKTSKKRGTYAPEAVARRRSIEDLRMDLELKSFDRIG